MPAMPLVSLRPLSDDDQALLASWRAGPPEPYGDWGDMSGALSLASLDRMLVLADGVPVGDVTWHPVSYGANAGSIAYNIGIDVRPEARGRGIGSTAQRLLAEHLFATADVHRVEASTDVENLAEQRALEKAGFTREGVLRGAQFRGDGIHHDLVGYAVLRTDPTSN